MDSATPRLLALYNRYLSNDATENEVKEFLSLLDEPGNEGLLEELLGMTWDEAEQKQQNITAVEEPAKKKIVPIYRRFSAIAASILVLICLGGYYTFVVLQNNKKLLEKSAALVKKDIPPGGNNAVLTLSDGSTIVLNDAKNGNLAEQGSADVVKLASGKLVYKSDGTAATEVVYNTITTPVGGQYQLTLSDGSVVRLNAASSIRFPASFVGKERVVTLTGEAYFEVAKNAAMPFIVKVKDMNVRVLGTHFNVMAYDEEKVIKTTLLEGKVNVFNGVQEASIKPGEQASAIEGKTDFKIKEVDIDEATAWISGFFQFENADVKTIMRQLSRWYDIDVVYQKTNDTRKFGGRMSRNQNLSEVLNVLQLNDLHFKIEGRKVMVLP